VDRKTRSPSPTCGPLPEAEDRDEEAPFTEQQVAQALRQAEQGTSAAEVCRKLGVSEATFYAWKKRYAGMGLAELRRVRQLEDENRRLKQVVADLTLDKQMLQEVLQKKV
jgi:putative transposase